MGPCFFSNGGQNYKATDCLGNALQWGRVGSARRTFPCSHVQMAQYRYSMGPRRFGTRDRPLFTDINDVNQLQWSRACSARGTGSWANWYVSMRPCFFSMWTATAFPAQVNPYMLQWDRAGSARGTRNASGFLAVPARASMGPRWPSTGDAAVPFGVKWIFQFQWSHASTARGKRNKKPLSQREKASMGPC